MQRGSVVKDSVETTAEEIDPLRVTRRASTSQSESEKHTLRYFTQRSIVVTCSPSVHCYESDIV